jgi:hypothetical protein
MSGECGWVPHINSTGTRWSLRERAITLFGVLESEDIEQFVSYDTTCETCGEKHYGILDESKLIFPIGRVAPNLRLNFNVETFRSTPSGWFPTYSGRTWYDVRQDIVRSGIYSRAQLTSVRECTGVFTQHELEVNDQSFKDIRPRRCGCNFGTPSRDEFSEEELRLIAEFSLDDGAVSQITAVESRFVTGNPVRTGFRRRSRDAIARRRAKRKGPARAPVTVECNAPSFLGFEGPVSVELTFNYIPKRDRDGLRRPSYRGVKKPLKLSYRQHIENWGFTSSPPTERKFRKYSYFFRRRKYWTLSKHHPLGGELSYFHK